MSHTQKILLSSRKSMGSHLHELRINQRKIRIIYFLSTDPKQSYYKRYSAVSVWKPLARKKKGLTNKDVWVFHKHSSSDNKVSSLNSLPHTTAVTTEIKQLFSLSPTPDIYCARFFHLGNFCMKTVVLCCVHVWDGINKGGNVCYS